jgi:hypothetical protein
VTPLGKAIGDVLLDTEELSLHARNLALVEAPGAGHMYDGAADVHGSVLDFGVPARRAVIDAGIREVMARLGPSACAAAGLRPLEEFTATMGRGRVEFDGPKLLDMIDRRYTGGRLCKLVRVRGGKGGALPAAGCLGWGGRKGRGAAGRWGAWVGRSAAGAPPWPRCLGLDLPRLRSKVADPVCLVPRRLRTPTPTGPTGCTSP